MIINNATGYKNVKMRSMIPLLAIICRANGVYRNHPAGSLRFLLEKAI